MRHQPRPGPPRTQAGYRGVLLAALGVGLAALGLVALPGGVMAVEFLVKVINGMWDSYTWEPF